jgi:hypothetical protein
MGWNEPADLYPYPYPIQDRPQFLQLILGGSLLVLKDESSLKDIREEFQQRLLVPGGKYQKKDENQYIVDYAAWSGCYETLKQALDHCGFSRCWPWESSSCTVLFSAERSGAVKTDDERIYVLSNCWYRYQKEIGFEDRPIEKMGELLKYFSSQSGTNLLHDAAKKGSMPILEFFQEKIPAFTWFIRSRCGASVLHYAAEHAVKSGSHKVIDFLYNLDLEIKKHGRIYFDINVKDNKGKTPIDWAIEATYPQLEKLEKELQEQICREKITKTRVSLAVGTVVTLMCAIKCTSVWLSVFCCCAGPVGVLLIALMIHCAYHRRISFFKPAEAYKKEEEFLKQRANVSRSFAYLQPESIH